MTDTTAESELGQPSAGLALPPGQPGIPPRWTSSAKSGVGRAAGDRARVWFTLSHGIVNEVYYPNVDQANVRDLGFLIADGRDFFSEEKRDAAHQVGPLEQGVPGYQLVNTCRRGRYRIEKTVLADADWDALVQHVRFESLQGELADYGLYVLLAPHLANRGSGNNGWVGDYKGIPMLFAERAGTALALACSTPFKALSCGYVGFSDGWQDVRAHKRMTWRYPRATDGNLGLTGEIDLPICGGCFTLVLTFGRTPAEAGERARAALLNDAGLVLERYRAEWRAFQAKCLDLASPESGQFDLYRTSTAVIKTHTATRFPGGICASLSIPWGYAKGDDDLGGYHLVWPRDLVESAGGLLAAGDVAGARRVLFFLMCTQEADGHWPQNMWLDGTPWWNGIQMDETAFPILLADALRRQQALDELEVWTMVRRAAGYLVCNGPVSPQDRWEEDGGYAPSTLAVEVAALLAAAEFADHAGQPDLGSYLRETADGWNDQIERWTYVADTDLARRLGVAGYYVRIAPPEVADAASPAGGFVPIKNRPPDQALFPVEAIVSPDALALVRFGLRAADDPRIVDTVKVIDARLKTETATGPVWHRYSNDGYGDHDGGGPFDGTGVGRGWPLLTGERGHYELAAGRPAEAARLLQVMAAQAGAVGLLPEQVWDGPDIPERELYNGHPAGSAMPLVWAHAEYVKLLRSLRDSRIFDLPPQTVQRYQVDRVTSPFTCWRLGQKRHTIQAGTRLRLELLRPARVHWSTDDWQTTVDTPTRDSGLGLYVADLPTARLRSNSIIRFTFYWLESGNWEGRDFEVQAEPPERPASTATRLVGGSASSCWLAAPDSRVYQGDTPCRARS
jgi:glucoamylase